MTAAGPDTRLSAEIRKIGESLCLASRRDLPDIGRLLVRLADLAHAQELELQLLRDMEAGRELRVGVREALDAQLRPLAADTSGNVIFSKFGREA